MEWDSEKADIATTEAEAELTQALVDGKIHEECLDYLTSWWEKWYNKTPDGKQGAGHKHLGRLLVSWAKETENKKPDIILGKDKRFHNGKDDSKTAVT